MNPQTKTDAIAAIATPPGEGAVAIQTLPIVNGKEFFTFTVVAADNPDGTGNVMEYPLSVDDPEGITIIEEEYNPHRFFSVKIEVAP